MILFIGTVGRVVTGLLADSCQVNRLVLQGVMIIMAGLFTAVVPWVSSFSLIMTYSSVYGYLLGETFVLKPLNYKLRSLAYNNVIVNPLYTCIYIL